MLGSSLLLDAAAIHGREVIPRIIKPGNPAAGVDFKVIVPGGSVWWLQTLRATFTASAAVANRVPNIVYADSDAEFWRYPNAGGIAASQALQYALADGLGYEFAVGGAPNSFFTSLAQMPLLGGWSIGSVTTLIDVADQWSAIALYVVEVEETPQLVELLRDLSRLRSGRADALPELGLRG